MEYLYYSIQNRDAASAQLKKELFWNPSYVYFFKLFKGVYWLINFCKKKKIKVYKMSQLNFNMFVEVAWWLTIVFIFLR